MEHSSNANGLPSSSLVPWQPRQQTHLHHAAKGKSVKPPPPIQTPQYLLHPVRLVNHHHQHHPQPLSLSRHSPRTPEVNKLPPASPQLISNLITSLSAISGHASNHFEGIARSPSGGSFGVTYGSRASENECEEDVSLDELAATSPVIKTAKPPSGLSPLTAPKSPPTRESTGLKSLLRNPSRPSSNGSHSPPPHADDTESIGNLSVERGTPPPPQRELRRQRSHDSWGKKTGRASKGLMYLSSKERLREKESEKRASFGAVGGATANLGAARPDPVLAETAIREEPGEQQHSYNNSAMLPSTIKKTSNNGRTTKDLASSGPRPIPTRDSSLRKTGPVTKRSSARSSRSKRDSDHEVIYEAEEYGRSSLSASAPTASTCQAPRWRHHSTASQDYKKRPEEVGVREAKDAAAPSPKVITCQLFEGTYFDSGDGELDDGAPFPAVAQGRRRDSTRGEQLIFGQMELDTGPRTSSKLRGSKGGSPNPTSPLDTTQPRMDRRGAFSPSPEPPSISYERPRSADSVDEAVESYLCSPRLSQKIRHPETGRVISFSEVGDSDGSAVFCCVGMGLTRYITAFYDELALTLKLRLITPDRPGVGDSEPYADGTATPLGWPDDVYAICQALKITKFSILAHSAGAIYALATALRMPQHIRGRIHLLAPWIPPSQMNVFGTSQMLPPVNSIPTSQRILRALPTPILKAANSSFMTATSSSITSSLPKTPRRKRAKASNNNNNNGRDTPSGRRDGNSGIHPSPSPPEKQHGDKENLISPARPVGPRPVGPPPATENVDQVHPVVSSLKLHSPAMSAGVGGASSSVDRDAVLAAAATTITTTTTRTPSALQDRERQTTYDSRLTHEIWELATTGANPAVDLLVCLERRHTIGFRYVDITRPVVIHHGSRDTRVPVENVRWLGKTMRRCEVRVLQGEGHGLMASPAVMGAVMMEISKEWEDWVNVTGGGGGGRSGQTGRRATITSGRGDGVVSLGAR